jgi:uncharacterized membrane protein
VALPDHPNDCRDLVDRDQRRRGSERLGPYPFVLLNLLLSVQAAHTRAVLLLSENRSAKRDRVIADLDFTNNEKGEQLVGALLN